ncbi:MAG: DNA polymerase Y family protein, partial [Betaproteobacteria bacterium]|nr:DNA polymerase Y family protein [Betaproteobacteria bacterium]
GPPRDAARALDALPLQCLDALAEHAGLLQRLGCRSLADVRALPRAGLARRCGPQLLRQLDQAYGEAAESYPWFALPERFHARLELPARVEDAAALLFGARRLLLQLEGWLGARQAGATALSLRWRGDGTAQRAGNGELALRSALPLRSAEQLARLLGEHLARVRLEAPVLELELELLDMRELTGDNASLLPGGPPPGAAAGPERELVLALQRVSARLGDSQVLQGRVLPDHRPEWAQAWHPCGAGPTQGAAQRLAPAGVRPSFLLPEPVPLACRDGLPCWHGELQLLLGPQRIEGGWWQRDGAGGTRHVARDYWVAAHARGALLWVFRSRERSEERHPAWFLHGVFA